MLLPLSEAAGVGLLAAVARLVVVWLFGFSVTNPTTGAELSAVPAHESKLATCCTVCSLLLCTR